MPHGTLLHAERRAQGIEPRAVAVTEAVCGDVADASDNTPSARF